MADDTTSFDPTDPVARLALNRGNFVSGFQSPEQGLYLRRLALMLQKQPEAKSWAGVLGNMAQAGVGTLMARQADERERGMVGYGLRPTVSSPDAGASPAPSDDASSAASPSASATDSGKSLAASYAPVLGEAGAAGLAGGFGHETAGTYSAAIPGDNGTSLGYAQWHDTSPGVGRKSNLAAYARKYGKSPTDPDVQRQYPLVEMGLAGDPSDPGYSTERKAGQALIAAKTPQEATAAALMYERPKGWSPDHPEKAAGYASRLAYANALMGGQGGRQGGAGGALPPPNHPWTIGGQPIPGGQPNSAGAAAPPRPAMAYADAGGSQGGGSPAWPAEKPQNRVPLRGPSVGMPGASAMAPAPGPVMAQNLPPGTQAVRGAPPMARPQQGGGSIPYGHAPVQGTRAFNEIMLNPMIPDDYKKSILEQQGSHPYTGSFNEPGRVFPNTGERQQLGPGSATLSTPSGTFPLAVTPGGVGKPPNAALVAPGAPAAGGDPLAGVKPIVRSSQEMAAEGNEAEKNVASVVTYRQQGSDAEAKIGQIAALRALGDTIESGFPAQLKNFVAGYGFDLDGSQGRAQAYKAFAREIMPADASPGFRETFPTLSPDKATRDAIADYYERQYKFLQARGEAVKGPGTYAEKVERAQRVKAPELPAYFTKGGPTAPAPAGGGAPAPAPAGAQAAPAGAAPAARGGGGGYAVGDTREGRGGVTYRFKGGDWRNRDNWEKVGSP